MESPISQFGLGLISADQLSEEVRDVLTLCESVREETSGAFDIGCVPAPNGSTLDPSGLVKGWSIERAAELLEAHGATNFCINAGGDIALRGNAEPDQPWRIGIRHPTEPLASAAVLSFGGRAAIATSATYERGAHIIDPKTGEPTTELASVTIVGEDLTYVDAYATAVFVMGLNGAEWLLETHPELNAFVIGHPVALVQACGILAIKRVPAKLCVASLVKACANLAHIDTPRKPVMQLLNVGEHDAVHAVSDACEIKHFATVKARGALEVINLRGLQRAPLPKQHGGLHIHANGVV